MTNVVLVTGVAGSGKSTVGRALAARLGWPFIEGDALHPAGNLAKMRRGEPLTDEDRAPWLAALRRHIDAHLRDGTCAVLATSALRRSYRTALRADDARVLVVFLDASPELAARRVTARTGHFFGPDLLASQYTALERPGHALILPAHAPIDELVDRIAAHIRRAAAD